MGATWLAVAAGAGAIATASLQKITSDVLPSAEPLSCRVRSFFRPPIPTEGPLALVIGLADDRNGSFTAELAASLRDRGFAVIEDCVPIDWHHSDGRPESADEVADQLNARAEAIAKLQLAHRAFSPESNLIDANKPDIVVAGRVISGGDEAKLIFNIPFTEESNTNNDKAQSKTLSLFFNNPYYYMEADERGRPLFPIYSSIYYDLLNKNDFEEHMNNTLYDLISHYISVIDERSDRASGVFLVNREIHLAKLAEYIGRGLSSEFRELRNITTDAKNRDDFLIFAADEYADIAKRMPNDAKKLPLLDKSTRLYRVSYEKINHSWGYRNTDIYGAFSSWSKLSKSCFRSEDMAFINSLLLSETYSADRFDDLLRNFDSTSEENDEDRKLELESLKIRPLAASAFFQIGADVCHSKNDLELAKAARCLEISHEKHLDLLTKKYKKILLPAYGSSNSANERCDAEKSYKIISDAYHQRINDQNKHYNIVRKYMGWK